MKKGRRRRASGYIPNQDRYITQKKKKKKVQAWNSLIWNLVSTEIWFSLFLSFFGREGSGEGGEQMQMIKKGVTVTSRSVTAFSYSVADVVMDTEGEASPTVLRLALF